MVLFEKYAEPSPLITRGTGVQPPVAALMLALKNNYAIIRVAAEPRLLHLRLFAHLPAPALCSAGAFLFVGKIAFARFHSRRWCFRRNSCLCIHLVSEFDRLSALVPLSTVSASCATHWKRWLRWKDDGLPRITREEGDLLTIEKMTLFTPDRTKLLVRDFDLRMQPGRAC